MGEILPTYLLNDVSLIFQASNGKEHVEKIDTILAIDIPKRDNNDPYGCSALLGMDLLERFLVQSIGPCGTAVAYGASKS